MKNLKKKLSLLLLTASLSALSIVNCFAGSTSPDFTGVSTAISGAGTAVTSEGVKVIATAISVGIVFWGANLLWSKFKKIAG